MAAIITDPTTDLPVLAPARVELRNLDQLLGDNQGGIEALWYCDVDDVLSVPDPDVPLLTGNVVLKPGRTWYQLVATLGTLGFTQPGKSDRHGPYWQPKLKGALAKSTAALAAGLEALDRRRFLVLYRDHNGLVWLVGSPDSPLSFLDTFDVGTPTARNGYDFTFSGETPRRARPYEGTWSVSGQGLQSGLDLNAGGGVVEIRDRDGNLMASVPAGRTVVVLSGFRVAYSIL
jgi:hypothetical protein